MIVRTLAQILGTDRDVAGRGWASRSLLLPGLFPARHAGPRRSELTIWYQHHLEACYRVEGVGEIGRVHPVCGFDMTGPGEAWPQAAPQHGPRTHGHRGEAGRRRGPYEADHLRQTLPLMIRTRSKYPYEKIVSHTFPRAEIDEAFRPAGRRPHHARRPRPGRWRQPRGGRSRRACPAGRVVPPPFAPIGVTRRSRLPALPGRPAWPGNPR